MKSSLANLDNALSNVTKLRHISGLQNKTVSPVVDATGQNKSSISQEGVVIESALPRLARMASQIIAFYFIIPKSQPRGPVAVA